MSEYNKMTIGWLISHDPSISTIKVEDIQTLLRVTGLQDADLRAAGAPDPFFELLLLEEEAIERAVRTNSPKFSPVPEEPLWRQRLRLWEGHYTPEEVVDFLYNL